MDRGAKILSSYCKYPFPKGKLAKQNLSFALARAQQLAEEAGRAATDFSIVVDTSSSAPNVTVGYAPCITRSHASSNSYWPLQYGRPFTVSELARLQGFDPATFLVNISANQLAGLLGNAFTCTTLGRVLNECIIAAEG